MNPRGEQLLQQLHRKRQGEEGEAEKPLKDVRFVLSGFKVGTRFSRLKMVISVFLEPRALGFAE